MRAVSPPSRPYAFRFIASILARPSRVTVARPVVRLATPCAAPPASSQSCSSPRCRPAAAGKQVFLSAGCTSCHTLKDAGSTGTVGPNLDDAKPPYDLVIDRVTNGMGGMPSFKGQLSTKQIQDVAKYVSSVAGK